MDAAERWDVTLRLVQGAERASVSELAARLGVSEMTVRRDLEALAQRGLVRRVHGGAVATRSPAGAGGFDDRAQWSAATKQRLGAAVAALIPAGSRVLLDAGTTTVHVARALRGPLSVTALSLPAAMCLAEQSEIDLLVAGGRVRHGEHSLVGPLAVRALEGLAFDVFVLSIGGVHAEYGWSEFGLDDAAVKQAGLAQSARVVAVADATKLGVRAFSRVAPLGAAHEFVTDRSASDPVIHPAGPPTLEALRDAGVLVHTI
ncbi:DeoR/GlpR transcriptional regulator [Nocardia yunnanensis]|uniref:Lactose phosphotransferase system repressor n=1 Tax=Nocardia yunnanensis TaxID=2382165 RepID=A0A386ZCZ5_9NOCA|nr:DeoR/GlpR family DNA-binding transcription regulator [Nocardia yunnanensis]AYF75732.1 DeoR/GlpR transcriptional regulator [Nocardia yunnanensis]